MRRLRVTRQEVESAVRNSLEKCFDDKGNALYLGYVVGVLVWIVVADDDPECIITIFEEGRR
ncbi:MAG TPA: hypothetical protein VJL81_16965 [Solirubrobacterales bacterium]|nr:hypothetical protein [Solirubrobacterales bacterium]